MSAFDEIHQEWGKSIKELNQSPWFLKMQRSELDICHYKGFLLETFHHAGLNPQIQAVATAYFKDNPRDMIKLFYRHAISEIGHDLLALADLAALGEDTEKLKKTRPLPSTVAFNAFALYQIQYVNPVAYLGYLFHLEFMPTQHGPEYIQNLMKSGVPESALTFIEEHATVDVGHNKMMMSYIDNLIKSEQDLNDVIYSAVSSCRLHGQMLFDAFANGEKVFAKKAS